MNDSHWFASEDPAEMLSFCVPRLGERKILLLGVGFCRLVGKWFPERWQRNAVHLAEHIADGRLERTVLLGAWHDLAARPESIIRNLLSALLSSDIRSS